MSETQNGSRDSVDTGPLTLDQLSDHELTIILSIEHQLQYTRVLTRSDKNAKPYLAPVQVRRPQVLLLDGARGTGKTSLLLTMAHRWNRHDGCDVEGHDRNDRDKQRTIRICDRLQLKHDGTLPEHIHPLRILDFDPLPPQMPLMAGIVQAWQPLAQEYDRLSRRPEECDDEDKTLEDYWNTLFRVATVGWSALPAARGLLEQVLDQQEQVSQWQRLGQLWQEFVTRLIVCGKCLRDAHKLRGEPVFVIMIDDVDLQVERIRELLPALRLLYHPNVAFLVAADWRHLIHILKLDFGGRQSRLAKRQAGSNVSSARDDERWAGTLAFAAATKVFPIRNKWTLRTLTLRDVLAFPNSEIDVDTPAGGHAKAQPTMKTVLDKWPEKPEKELGDYLLNLAGPQDDFHEIQPFITYRNAHQIFENALVKGEGEESAIEAVRCLLSDPGLEAVTLGNARGAGPIVEYRGVGHLTALFRPDYTEGDSASQGVVLSARPDFVYRKEATSDAVSMREYVGADVNFNSAMLAASIQDGRYGVAAPSLQWDVRLALVWTRVEVADENALLKLAFQWRFHEHPHPLQLVKWSREWREFVRSIQSSPERRLDRIAYAWLFYQLKWLGAEIEDTWNPSNPKGDIDERLMNLLTVSPRPREDKEGRPLDWRTQTLPLLARPEIGLTPAVQSLLLQSVNRSSDDEEGRKHHDRQLQWLRDQRERLVTDAIIAAAEAEGRRAEKAENTERVSRVLKKIEKRYKESNDDKCPWSETIDKMLKED